VPHFEKNPQLFFWSLDHLAVGSFAVMAADNMADSLEILNRFCGILFYWKQVIHWASNWGTSYCCPLSRSIGRRVVWTPLMLLAAVTTMGKQRLQPNFGNAGSVNTLIVSNAGAKTPSTTAFRIDNKSYNQGRFYESDASAKAANRPPMGSSVCSEL
jgi:hypothetical protein